MNIEDEIIKIKERNQRVESDKAWEISFTRKITLTVITYIVITIVLLIIKNPNPFVNALVPTFGYLLSILSLKFIKEWWVKRFKK